MAGLTGSLFEQQGIRASTQAAQTQATRNQQIAQRNEVLATEQANEESDLIRRQTKRDISSAIATSAASGVVTTAGSPLLAQLEIAFEGEKAALTRIRQGEIEAQGFKSEAEFRGFERDIAGVRGKIARSSSLLRGITQDAQQIAQNATTGAKLFGGGA